MKKTDTRAQGLDFIQARLNLVAYRYLMAAPLLFLSAFLCQGEPSSLAQPATENLPVMSAWSDPTTSKSRKHIISSTDDPDLRWQNLLHTLTDRSKPWKLTFKSPVENPVEFGTGLVSVSGSISAVKTVPLDPLDFDSHPTDFTVTNDSRHWTKSSDEAGQSIQFSSGSSMSDFSPVTAETRSHAVGQAIDYSGPGTMRAALKGASAGSERVNVSGDLPGLGGDDNPQNPISYIATPEPEVTALWGLSAVLFALRKKFRRNS